MVKIAIIGAGFSGLTLANLLKEYAEITLFEKARGVSGRMSTRRAEPYFFDHGAQYFTVRTSPFKDFIQPLFSKGIIKPWHTRYVKILGSQIIENRDWQEEEPRYVGVPGMNAVGKFLVKGLQVKINTRVDALDKNQTWQLTDHQGQQYSDFDWVICTAPAPQTLALLPETFKYHADIKDIKMRPCFSLMLGFKHDLTLEFDAAHVIDSDIGWIAVNNRKPKRSGAVSLLVHSSEKYSETNLEATDEQVRQDLIKETSHVIGCDVSSADYIAVHRWKYASNFHISNENTVFIDLEKKLAACGDWCLGGRVEGAFTSAYKLAQKMKESIL